MGRRSPSSETYVATPANSATSADPRSRSSPPMSSPTARMKQRRTKMIWVKMGSIRFPTIVKSAVLAFVSPPISSSICKAILLRLLFGFLWLCVKHWIPIERTPKCEEADGNDLEWTSSRAGVTPLRSSFKPRLNHAQEAILLSFG